jgi:serine/threonine protein kinase/Tfp pilus assembly protein PilF
MTPQAGGSKAVPNALQFGTAPVSDPSRAALGAGELKLEIHEHELIRRIGRGAYGEVWLARNALGAGRAIKIVYRKDFEDSRPFEREFEGIQKFEPISRSHPGFVNILQVGRHEDYFYYVMELADGFENPKAETRDPKEVRNPKPSSDLDSYIPRTLREDLRQNGRLPATQVLEIGAALTSALAHLHRQGLVHRDIKPSNIIFVKGLPKLADIGLVTEAGDSRSVVGTAGYLPPEGPGTPQADLFALGKVLYEAVTGLDRRDFPDLPPDLRSWPETRLFFEINQICLQACATNPRQRYTDAQAALSELALLQRGKSVRRKRTLKQRLATAKALLVAVALAGVSAGAGTILWRQFHQIRPLSANPEAEKLYRQAVYQIQSRTLLPLQGAYTNLSASVQLDSGFVDAHYQMFELYMGSLGDKLPPYYNQYTNFLMVTRKLAALSPNSVQYHTANSMVKFLDWKFDEAIKEAELAIKINPKFMRAHGFYGFYVLLARGDTVTALEQFKLAERLDPVDTTIQSSLGRPFYVERKFDLAIKQFQKALELEPREAAGHLNLARAFEADKQCSNALNEYWKLALLTTDDEHKTNARFEKQSKDLRERGPRGWYEGLLEEARRAPNPSPYLTAALCARLGKTNDAIELLNLAYHQHSPRMERLIEDDCWDSLRSDPRFQDLLKNMGFPAKARTRER